MILSLILIDPKHGTETNRRIANGPREVGEMPDHEDKTNMNYLVQEFVDIFFIIELKMSLGVLFVTCN